MTSPGRLRAGWMQRILGLDHILLILLSILVNLEKTNTEKRDVNLFSIQPKMSLRMIPSRVFDSAPTGFVMDLLPI